MLGWFVAAGVGLVILSWLSGLVQLDWVHAILLTTILFVTLLRSFGDILLPRRSHKTHIANKSVPTITTTTTTTTTVPFESSDKDASGLISNDPAIDLPSTHAARMQTCLHQLNTEANDVLDVLQTKRFAGSAWTPLVDSWEADNGVAVLRDTTTPFRFAFCVKLSCPSSHAFRILGDESNWKSRALEKEMSRKYSRPSIIKGVRRVGPLGVNGAIIHISILPFLLISGRDILIALYKWRLPNGNLAITVFSTEDDRVPVAPGTVHVDVKLAGAVFMRRPRSESEIAKMNEFQIPPFAKVDESGEESDGCTIVYVVDADPKAWIPVSLLGMLARQIASPAAYLLNKLLLRANRFNASSPIKPEETPSESPVEETIEVAEPAPRSWLDTTQEALAWASPFMLATVYVVAAVELSKMWARPTRARIPVL